MNILFLNPPFKGRFSRTSRSPAITKGGTLYYPIWLAYAAGASGQAGHNVRLIDSPAYGYDIDRTFLSLNGFIPDMAVIDTSTPSIYSDVSIAEQVKIKFPNCFVVMVGTHPSALPVETISLNTNIDAVAIGEYDHTIRDLAAALESADTVSRVDGIVFRKNGIIHQNNNRDKIEDLDSLPFVSSVYKKNLKHRNYFFAAAGYPMVMIITGRGCPHRCFFCVYPQTFHSRRYRTRSAENVVAEFEYIIKELPDVKEIGIEDDCFTASRRHAREICELLIKKNVRTKWYCNVRGDVDYDLLKLMKQAGCRLVTVGFESGSQEVLDNMQKDQTLDQYYCFAKDARRAGILVHGCIMVGNPGDTYETLAQSYEFSLRINCDSMQFYPLYVYPGTEAYLWAKEKGYLKTENYSEWLTPDGLHNCVISTPELSSDDMVRLCDSFLKKYHLRPGYILAKLNQALHNPAEGFRTAKSAKVFLSKIVSGQVA